MTTGLPSLDRRSIVAGLASSPVADALAPLVSGCDYEKLVSAFTRARDQVDGHGVRLVDLECQWCEKDRNGRDKSIRTSNGTICDRDLGEPEVVELNSRSYEGINRDAKRLENSPQPTL